MTIIYNLYIARAPLRYLVIVDVPRGVNVDAVPEKSMINISKVVKIGFETSFVPSTYETFKGDLFPNQSENKVRTVSNVGSKQKKYTSQLNKIQQLFQRPKKDLYLAIYSETDTTVGTSSNTTCTTHECQTNGKRP